MIDFRALSYFIAACEHENLGAAAKALAIAPSTLSASLKSLEQEFGVSLFRKQGAGLSPRKLADWLYRAAVPLLLLESFACRRAGAAADAPAHRLQIEIGLRFAFGQLSRALNRAMQQVADAAPLLLCEADWTMETGAAVGAATSDQLAFAGESRVAITVATAPALEPGQTLLMEDPWMIVRRQIASGTEREGSDLSDVSVLVPAMPQPLIEQVSAHLAAAGIVNVQHVDLPPGAWPALLDEYPGAAILLPASALAIRMGVIRVAVEPLDPPLATRVIGVHGDDPIARDFVARLRAELHGDCPATLFDPILTGRRIRYFNLAYELGRVSAAARVASVAQPALSQQLQKLEASLGVLLFERRAFGLVRTEAGTQFARAAALLDKRLRELEMSGMSASLAEGGRLSLGVLPSVSHHGHLVSRIAEAVIALRDRYPEMSLTVQEAPNGTLQNWISRGRVGVAVVETALPHLPRLPLDAVEDLSVIVDPRHALVPPGPVALRDLVDVPLALPTTLFGLRQLVDDVARSVGVELRPRHQIDALPLLIAMLTREAIATVLPASAVQPEIDRGELVAHRIVDPGITRRLYVIYSADRSLTPAERDLVRLLRGRLARPREERRISATVAEMRLQ